MIRFLLDTNTISELFKKAPNPGVAAKMRRHEGEVGLAASSWHELIHGCLRLPETHPHREGLERYLRAVRSATPILPYDYRAARWHGEERARLYQRTPPYPDSQIAAVAAVNGLVSITANVNDFAAFANLKVESWMA